jgi:hypothetical protein
VYDLIFHRRHRDGEVQLAKFDGIQEDLVLGVSLDSLEATVGSRAGPIKKLGFAWKSQDCLAAGFAWMRMQQPTGVKICPSRQAQKGHQDPP